MDFMEPTLEMRRPIPLDGYGGGDPNDGGGINWERLETAYILAR